MINHFEELEFAFPWRDYQARVLSELEQHLDDNHLHVVAAPGSGKTVLGLEVMRQLGKPCVIFAPTITIRNQWIERLTGMFMEGELGMPEWISTDLRDPKFLTVVTYQALNAALTGNKLELNQDGDEALESIDIEETAAPIDVVTLLNDIKVRTVVLDEAHHLRKEWWKSLVELKDGLTEPTMVSLTATPPYDVELSEWQRYEDLCGPVDAEISVPELVQRSDLCPHQDYVFFSLPTPEELKKVRQFSNDVSAFVESLKNDKVFLSIIASHSWLKEPETYIENILGQPQLYSAFIIFLNACEIEIRRDVLKVLGVRRRDIPPLDANWLEVFLSAVLFTTIEDFEAHEPKLNEIRAELKRIGAIERRKVVVNNTKALQQILAGSLGKLNSIYQITKNESDHLGQDLRMVILTDYIRKDQMPKNDEDTRPIEKIGVVPIFERLRRKNIQGIRLGILTGSLIIIPVEAKPILERHAVNLGVDLHNISHESLLHDGAFLRVDIKGQQRQNIVALITEVFNEGGITVLIGTQALLGEGWDAPSINTLVLASYVGSYMLSNQMRGRAIRIDPNAPNKVANIWHLVALDIESVQEKIKSIFLEKVGLKKNFDTIDQIKEDLGQDVLKMRRRFRAFEGLSHKPPHTIENGFKRLGLADVEWTNKGIETLNKNMVKQAQERDQLQRLWKHALQGKNKIPKLHDKVKSSYVPRYLSFMETLEYLIMNALFAAVIYIEQVFHGLGRGLGRNISFDWFLAILLIVPVFYTIPKLVKALYLFMRNGTVENCMEQVGMAVIESLHHANLIKTHPKDLIVTAFKGQLGAVDCRLDGATTMERRIFLDAIQEVLGPMDNPKYLLVRKSPLGPWMRVDYHSVPKALSQKKQFAEFFAKSWRKHVGRSDLIYTRTIDGRQTLLKARTRSLSSAFQKKTDRFSVWE